MLVANLVSESKCFFRLAARQRPERLERHYTIPGRMSLARLLRFAMWLFSRLDLLRNDVVEPPLTITERAVKAEFEPLCNGLIPVTKEEQDGAVNRERKIGARAHERIVFRRGHYGHDREVPGVITHDQCTLASRAAGRQGFTAFHVAHERHEHSARFGLLFNSRLLADGKFFLGVLSRG
jgi:hypothetical protein